MKLFCRARVKMPKSAIDEIMSIYAHLKLPVRAVRETDITEPFSLCPKNGRMKNIAAEISSIPNTRSRRWLSFVFVSSSAIVRISSLDKSSSIVTEKNFAIAFNESMLGYPRPDSHLETAVRDTNNISASSS